MSEHSIMEVIKTVISFMLIMLLVAVGMLGFQLQGINSYKQQVNYTIEREGGLTANARTSLAEYSEDNYNGMFTVDTVPSGDRSKKEYGDIVTYQIKADIPIPLFPVPDLNLTFNGASVSQIR